MKVYELRPGQVLADGRKVREKSLPGVSGKLVVRFDNADDWWTNFNQEVRLAEVPDADA
jgi:hypothetical protein